MNARHAIKLHAAMRAAERELQDLDEQLNRVARNLDPIPGVRSGLGQAGDQADVEAKRQAVLSRLVAARDAYNRAMLGES